MEKREKALTTQENEVSRMRADLQHESERFASEAEVRDRRAREDTEYKIDLERFVDIYILFTFD